MESCDIHSCDMDILTVEFYGHDKFKWLYNGVEIWKNPTPLLGRIEQIYFLVSLHNSIGFATFVYLR